MLAIVEPVEFVDSGETPRTDMYQFNSRIFEYVVVSVKCTRPY